MCVLNVAKWSYLLWFLTKILNSEIGAFNIEFVSMIRTESNADERERMRPMRRMIHLSPTQVIAVSESLPHERQTFGRN